MIATIAPNMKLPDQYFVILKTNLKKVPYASVAPTSSDHVQRNTKTHSLKLQSCCAVVVVNCSQNETRQPRLQRTAQRQSQRKNFLPNFEYHLILQEICCFEHDGRQEDVENIVWLVADNGCVGFESIHKEAASSDQQSDADQQQLKRKKPHAVEHSANKG